MVGLRMSHDKRILDRHIVVAFSHDPTDRISRGMAWCTFGAYTHIALVNADQVIEASAVGRPRGVRGLSLYDFMACHPGAVLRKIDHPNPEGVWFHAQSDIGLLYDWGWLWGWIFRMRNWQHPGRRACSELITGNCIKAGYALFAGDHAWHVSPQLLYMISTPLDK